MSFLPPGATFQLPDLGFLSNKPSQAQKNVVLRETSFFAKCKIQLKSSNKRIGTKRDKKGTISITSGPSNIRYTIEKILINIKPTDESLELERKNELCCTLTESSRSKITTWFTAPVELLSYITTILLHRRSEENEKYLDGYVGTGHIINDEDDYDVELTSWKIKSKFSLGDLIDLSRTYRAEDAPKSVYMSGIGLGGVRVFFTKKKYICAVVTEVREYRRRVRTQVIYPQLQKIERLTQQLLFAHEAAVKRQRIVQTTKQMKKKLDELTANVDTNSILIEQMYKDQKDFENKIAEIERAKRRIDVDDNEKQLNFMKEQEFLTQSYNETIEKQDQMEFDMIRWQGESGMLGKCIADAFTVLCVGMTETSEGETLVERLESVRRQIAEAVFL